MKHSWNDPPEWQKDYFGRHVSLVPARDARGYQYQPFAGSPVVRAIPVDGMITQSSAFDKPAPQVDLRLREPESKASRLGRRLREMIKGHHV